MGVQITQYPYLRILGYAIAEDRERRHGLGAVPLVPFLFETTSPMTGLPATDDVLSLILRIYRRDSELDKMLFDRAVPLLNVGGVSQEHWDTFVVASSNALMSTEPGGITAQYVEPVRHRVSGAGRSPCPRRGQRAGNLPSYGPSAIRRGRVRRVQGHRQNAARHAACQLRPAQRQRGSPLLEARRPVAWSERGRERGDGEDQGADAREGRPRVTRKPRQSRLAGAFIA